MRRSGLVPAAWGAFLIAMALTDLAYGPVPQEIEMLGGAGLAMVLIGGLSWLTERRRLEPRPDDDVPRPLPDLSVSTVVLALGIAILIVGYEFGPWCVFIGGGTIVVAIAGLIREFRAERRAAGSA